MNGVELAVNYQWRQLDADAGSSSNGRIFKQFGAGGAVWCSGVSARQVQGAKAFVKRLRTTIAPHSLVLAHKSRVWLAGRPTFHLKQRTRSTDDWLQYRTSR